LGWSSDEVEELTAVKRWSARCRALARMVSFRPNAVGRPLVERAALLTTPGSRPASKPREPNWDALAT
jgi:hypothetical protein